MRKPFTLALTIFGALLCLVHYIGHEYDPIYLLFYALSVPAWFAPAFGDITRINIVVVYALTVLSYAFMGYLIDFFIARSRSRNRGNT
jgi:hypothetical protein